MASVSLRDSHTCVRIGTLSVTGKQTRNAGSAMGRDRYGVAPCCYPNMALVRARSQLDIRLVVVKNTYGILRIVNWRGIVAAMFT